MGLVAVGLWVAAVWGLCGKAKSCERGVTGDGFSWDRRIARKLAVGDVWDCAIWWVERVAA